MQLNCLNISEYKIKLFQRNELRFYVVTLDTLVIFKNKDRLW